MPNHIVGNLKKPFSQMTYKDLIPVLKESLMADTIKQFHVDQKAQKEFEEIREKLTEMEKMMKVTLLKEYPSSY